MKKFLLALSIGLFALTACSDDDKDDEQEVSIQGTWTASSSETFSYEQSTNDTVFYFKFPADPSNKITFGANGMGTITTEDSTQTMSYTYTGNMLTITSPNEAIEAVVDELTATSLIFTSTTIVSNGGTTVTTENTLSYIR